MLFAVDIDQTISSGYIGSSVADSLAYYRARGISVPASATRYLEFFQLPAILRIHEELPGACAGVRRLHELGTVGYFTVRKSEDQAERAAIEQATRDWLAEHHFPVSENVTFCPGMPRKLLAIAKAAGSDEPMTLVDDNWRAAIEALALLAQHSAEMAAIANQLRERLTLVAFGASEQDVLADASVRVLALPSWSQLETLEAYFNKEDSHAIRLHTPVSDAY